MNCPFCGHTNDRVVDSRESGAGDAIRRRRECLECSRRFTSYERIEEIPYLVVKKDGRREAFDRQKLMTGLSISCEKRPVPAKELSRIVDDVEQRVHDSPDREVEAGRIGEWVMERLRELDKVAYVRFASVYRQFEDVEEFMSELRGLLATRKTADSIIPKKKRPDPGR
jgi:transcriptional repressor NrdR